MAQAGNDFNKPFPPHRVIDNVYFVGTEALGTFLITTPAGHILINSDFEATVPLDPAQRRRARLQIRRHQDPARQPRARRPHGGRRAGQAAHGRAGHGDGRGRARPAHDEAARQGTSDRSRTARRRTGFARRHHADRASHARSHEGLHELGAEGDRKRQPIRRADRLQLRRQRQLRARRQPRLSRNRRRLRSHVREGAHAAGRRVPGRARRLLRLDGKYAALQKRAGPVNRIRSSTTPVTSRTSRRRRQRFRTMLEAQRKAAR